MRFDFIVIIDILLFCSGFLFVFGHGISFFGRYPPVNVYSTADCDFNALTGGDEHTFVYSSMLNWKSKTLKISKLRFSPGESQLLIQELFYIAWISCILFNGLTMNNP